MIGVLDDEGRTTRPRAVQTEFRSSQDVYERISGGAGPGGVKAVAPVGDEPISITIPAGVDQVSLLGEVLDAIDGGRPRVGVPGRPVAIVSKVMIDTARPDWSRR